MKKLESFKNLKDFQKLSDENISKVKGGIRRISDGVTWKPTNNPWGSGEEVQAD